MAQLEEVQFVHWGSMRPDTVPLAAPGISMFVGPNGSGKTCCLDGIKVLLGVGDLGGVRSPHSYIFDGRPSGQPAERAWLRGTFINPVSPGQRHRVFAAAGDGCQDAEHVTVICRVQGDKRQYLVLPGRVAWGRDQPIQADLDELAAKYPDNRWRGPQQYDNLLDRVGITKALRGVLALPQGQTDRLVSEPPTGLMRRLLDLTGRQGTLEQFRIARTKHDEAFIAHRDAERLFEHKKLELDRLEIKVRQHRDWTSLKAQLKEIDELLFPAARHYEAKESLELLKADITEAERICAELRGNADTLRRECDEEKIAIDALAATESGVAGEVNDLKTTADAAVEAVGRLRERAGGIWRSLDEMRSLVVGVTLDQATARAEECEKALVNAFHRHLALDDEHARHEDDRVHLSNEGSMAPREVREFCSHLRALGYTPTIIGDVLAKAATISEIDDALRAQAALGDALWGVTVPAVEYPVACGEAVVAGFQWPIIRQGAGSPKGVLAIGGPSFLGQLLEELDASPVPHAAATKPLLEHGQHVVTADGMRYGPTLARLAPERDVILHTEARERRMKQHVDALDAAEREQTVLEEQIVDLRAQLYMAYSIRDAARRRAEQRSALREACSDLIAACEERDQAQAGYAGAQRRQNDLKAEIADRQAGLRTKKTTLQRQETETSEKCLHVRKLQEKRVECELKLEDIPLPPAFTSSLYERLEPERELAIRHGILSTQAEDHERYPADVRDPIIVAQWESEEERLHDVSELIDGKTDELASRAAVLKEARSRYDNHIKALVRELRNRFVEICAIARIDGDIRLIAGDTPEDYGVDVLVSHKEGETPVSYRFAGHSGGQRTKIAILLLLAAMSLGRTADLLIVDEHQAHLDGTNSGQIVEIMRNLAERAQFILSAPSSGHGDDAVSWCDLQITFLPRISGALHSPPLRLMSRIDAAQFEQRFVPGQQPLA